MFLRKMAPPVSKPVATPATRSISHTAPVSAVSLPVVSEVLSIDQVSVAITKRKTAQASLSPVETAKPLPLLLPRAVRVQPYLSLAGAVQPLPSRSALVRAMSTENSGEFFNEMPKNKNTSSSTAHKRASHFPLQVGLGMVSFFGTLLIVDTLLKNNDKDNIKKDDQAKLEEKYTMESARLVELTGQKYVKEFDEDFINILIDDLIKMNPYYCSEDLAPDDITKAVVRLPYVIRLATELFSAEEDKVSFNPELSSKLEAYFLKTEAGAQAEVIKTTYPNASKDYIHLMHFLLVNQAILSHHSALVGEMLGEEGFDFLSQYKLSEQLNFLVKHQTRSPRSVFLELGSSPRMGSRY